MSSEEINIKEIEKYLNELFETNIQWSKLSIEELNQIVKVFAENSKLLNFIKKLIKALSNEEVKELIKELPSESLGEICIDWLADKLAGIGKTVELLGVLVPQIRKIRETTQQLADKVVIIAKILEKTKSKK